MTPRQRLTFLAIAVVIAIGAVVVISSIGSDDDESSPSTVAETGADPVPAPTTTPVGTATTTTPAPRKQRPRPTYQRIRVRGLKPVGGVEEIEVEKGDTVRFEVISDQAEEVHLHGYDISKDLAPGRAARFRFEADIEGIFEIELEHSAVPIAELRVEPR